MIEPNCCYSRFKNKYNSFEYKIFLLKWILIGIYIKNIFLKIALKRFGLAAAACPQCSLSLEQLPPAPPARYSPPSSSLPSSLEYFFLHPCPLSTLRSPATMSSSRSLLAFVLSRSAAVRRRSMLSFSLLLLFYDFTWPYLWWWSNFCLVWTIISCSECQEVPGGC